MFKFFLFFLVIVGIPFVFTSTSIAQNKTISKEKARQAKHERINQMLRTEEEGLPAFKKHSITQFSNQYDGWGVLIEKGFSTSAYKATLFQFEIGEKKHPKEQKQSTQGSVRGGLAYFGRPFVFGKQNILYQAKLGVGKQILFGGKSNKNGVAVYGVFLGGFNAGLIRPYFLQFSSTSGVEYLKYDANTKDAFFNADPNRDIIGGAGFKMGWNELKFNPGVYAKASLRFDWARFNQVISAIEIGFMADVYSKKVIQMIDVPGKAFFPTGFLALDFGRRK